MNDYANFYRQIAELERQAERGNRRQRRSGAAWERVQNIPVDEIVDEPMALERARRRASDVAQREQPYEGLGFFDPVVAAVRNTADATLDSVTPYEREGEARRIGDRVRYWDDAARGTGRFFAGVGDWINEHALDDQSVAGALDPTQSRERRDWALDTADRLAAETGNYVVPPDEMTIEGERPSRLGRLGTMADDMLWTGLANAREENTTSRVVADEMARYWRERGDEEKAQTWERAAQDSAAMHMLLTASGATEFIPGFGVVPGTVSAARGTARLGLEALGQEVPSALRAPIRNAPEREAAGPLTENARGWRNNFLLGGGAYLAADAVDGELGDDYTAPAIAAGGAMVLGRRFIPHIDSAIPEDIQHLARQGEIGPDGARNYTPNPRQRLTVDPEGRVAMDYEGSFNAGDGASVGEVRTLMRGAREAINDDIATTRRSEYSWTPNGESQARLYRNEFERNTPENYAFSETPQGEMRLRRLGAEFDPDPLQAERVADDAPFGFDGAPASPRIIDAEATPAPSRRFEAAIRDPETGRVYTGQDHYDAIASAPDDVQARLSEIYEARVEDQSVIGFQVDGQFMGREEGLQALRAQRRPVRIGEQVNRDGSVTPRSPIDWDNPNTRLPEDDQWFNDLAGMPTPPRMNIVPDGGIPGTSADDMLRNAPDAGQSGAGNRGARLDADGWDERAYYHGGPGGIEALDLSRARAGNYGPGIYVSRNADIAGKYADEAHGRTLYQVQVRPGRQLDLTTPEGRAEYQSLSTEELHARYDSLRAPGETVIFNPQNTRIVRPPNAPDGGASGAGQPRIVRRTLDAPHAPGYGTGTFEILQNPTQSQLDAFMARELRTPVGQQWTREARGGDPRQYYPLRFVRDADGNVYVSSGLAVEHDHMASGLRANGINMGQGMRGAHGSGMMQRRDGQWVYERGSVSTGGDFAETREVYEPVDYYYGRRAPDAPNAGPRRLGGDDTPAAATISAGGLGGYALGEMLDDEAQAADGSESDGAMLPILTAGGGAAALYAMRRGRLGEQFGDSVGMSGGRGARRLGGERGANPDLGLNAVETEARTAGEQIGLSAEQRAALTADQSYIIERRLQGADYDTIAGELSTAERPVTVNTVTVQISKARRRLNDARMPIDMAGAPMGRPSYAAATDDQIIALRDQLRAQGESNAKGGVNTIIAERFGMTPNAVAQRISNWERRRNTGAAAGLTALGGGALLLGDEAQAQEDIGLPEITDPALEGARAEGDRQTLDLGDGRLEHRQIWRLSDGSYALRVTVQDVSSQNQVGPHRWYQWAENEPLMTGGSGSDEAPSRRLGEQSETSDRRGIIGVPLGIAAGAAISRRRPVTAAGVGAVVGGGSSVLLDGNDEDVLMSTMLPAALGPLARHVGDYGVDTVRAALPSGRARIGQLADSLSNEAPIARGQQVMGDDYLGPRQMVDLDSGPFDVPALDAVAPRRMRVTGDEIVEQGYSQPLEALPSMRERYDAMRPAERLRLAEAADASEQIRTARLGEARQASTSARLDRAASEWGEREALPAPVTESASPSADQAWWFDPVTGEPLYGAQRGRQPPPRTPRRPIADLGQSAQQRRLGEAEGGTGAQAARSVAERELGQTFQTGAAAMRALRERMMADPAFAEKMNRLYPALVVAALGGGVAAEANRRLN